MAITSSTIRIYTNAACTQLAKTVYGGTTPSQTISITGLSEHTNYWAKAEATNSDSLTAESVAYPFQTLYSEPVISVVASNVTQTTATLTYSYTGNYPLDTSNYTGVSGSYWPQNNPSAIQYVQFYNLTPSTSDVFNLTGLTAGTTYVADFNVDYYDGEVSQQTVFTTTAASSCTCTFTSNNTFIRTSHQFSFSFKIDCNPATSRIVTWWGTDPTFQTNTGTTTQTNVVTSQTFNQMKNNYLPDSGGILYQKVQVTLSNNAVYTFTNQIAAPVVNWDVNSTCIYTGNLYKFTATTSNPAQSNNVYKVKDNWIVYQPTGGSATTTPKVSALGAVDVTLTPGDYTIQHWTEDYWNNQHYYTYNPFSAPNPAIIDITVNGTQADFDLAFYPGMDIDNAVLEYSDGNNTYQQRISPTDSTTWVITGLDIGLYTVVLIITSKQDTYKSSTKEFKIE